MAISQVADLHIHLSITHWSLSNGNSEGALAHAQQWLISISLSPETSLLVHKDAELNLQRSFTVTDKKRRSNVKSAFLKKAGIKQSLPTNTSSEEVVS